MNINDLAKREFKKNLALGKHNVVFDHIEYRTDDEGDITGIYVHIEAFKPLFVPFFDNGENYQLDLLLEQLNVDSYAPDEINRAKGTTIICHRYERVTDTNTYTNVSFNPRYVPESDRDAFF